MEEAQQKSIERMKKLYQNEDARKYISKDWPSINFMFYVEELCRVIGKCRKFEILTCDAKYKITYWGRKQQRIRDEIVTCPKVDQVLIESHNLEFHIDT